LNNAPTWRDVRSGESHTTQVRGRETGVLIQAGGETWRRVRNGPITLVFGTLLILVPVLIWSFYRYSGPMKLHGKPSGRMIERFNGWERLVHWFAAVSFVVLAITGILMLFGKHFLLPVIGYNAFSWFGAFSKNLHNFVGPLFIFCVACIFVTFLRDNFSEESDMQCVENAAGADWQGACSLRAIQCSGKRLVLGRSGASRVDRERVRPGAGLPQF
jgi:formate dehydrogenase subunit gamma